MARIIEHPDGFFREDYVEETPQTNLYQQDIPYDQMTDEELQELWEDMEADRILNEQKEYGYEI